MLWPENRAPSLTEYTDNSAYRYNHNPDFAPFMYEMLVPEEVTPMGAIILCAGGDHGFYRLCEGFIRWPGTSTKWAINASLLLNRTNLKSPERQRGGS